MVDNSQRKTKGERKKLLLWTRGHEKRSRVDTTADFGNIEISTHGCLASVTVGWPSVWLVGVVTRISLFVVAEGWQFINSPIKSGP